MNRSHRHANILFIHAESMDGRKLGCLGDPAARQATPNLDRLAGSGMVFSDAYSICPVCNPSRAGMWTGQYPHHYDCWNNHEGLRPGVPTWQQALERSGYRFEALGPLDYQYGMHSIRDRVGSWTRAAGIHRPLSRTRLPRVIQEPSFPADDRTATQTREALRQAAADERPFMIYWTTQLVHPPFLAESGHLARIDPETIAIPPGLGGLDEAAHPCERYTRVTKNMVHAFSESRVRHLRHCYYAMIAALDEKIGGVLRELDDLGLRDSTYVIFSSDHGEMAGEHNQILKRTFYEPSVRVPLIISGPEVRKGERVTTPVSLVDLYPTILDMAGVDFGNLAGREDFPDRLAGESLGPLLHGNSGAHRGWAMAEYHGDRCRTGTFMLRRGEWKLIRHTGFASQLFHVPSDPWEQHDRAGEEPALAAELESFLTARFPCDAIDARAKQYDREQFIRWREEQQAAGAYEEMMSWIYSGYDLMSIEEIRPWTAADEEQIEAWLAGP